MIFNAILIAAAALLAGLAHGQRTQSVWGQCGGLQYSGPTNCAQGNYCSYGNDYYYQCVPGTAVEDEPLETDTPDEPEEGEPTEEEPGEEEEPEPTPIQIIPTRSSIRGPFPTVTRTIFNPNPTGPSRGGGASVSVIVIGGRTYSLVVPKPTAAPSDEEEVEQEVEEVEEEGEEDEGEEYGDDGAPAAKGKALLLPRGGGSCLDR